MFLRCRNPAPCSLRSHGAAEHTPPPGGAGEIRVSLPPPRFSPRRGAGVCSSAIRDREGAGADLPHPRPLRGGPAPGRGRGAGGKRVSPGRVSSSGETFSPPAGSPLGGPADRPGGMGCRGATPAARPSLATVKCAFQDPCPTPGEGQQAMLASS